MAKYYNLIQVGTPTGLNATLQAGGSLPVGTTYYYRVIALRRLTPTELATALASLNDLSAVEVANAVLAALDTYSSPTKDDVTDSTEAILTAIQATEIILERLKTFHFNRQQVNLETKEFTVFQDDGVTPAAQASLTDEGAVQERGALTWP